MECSRCEPRCYRTATIERDVCGCFEPFFERLCSGSAKFPESERAAADGSSRRDDDERDEPIEVSDCVASIAFAYYLIQVGNCLFYFVSAASIHFYSCSFDDLSFYLKHF